MLASNRFTYLLQIDSEEVITVVDEMFIRNRFRQELNSVHTLRAMMSNAIEISTFITCDCSRRMKLNAPVRMQEKLLAV